MKRTSIMNIVVLLCVAFSAEAWQSVTWDFYSYGRYLPNTNNVITTSSNDMSKWSEYLAGSAAKTSRVYDDTLGSYVTRINTLGTNGGAAWSSPCDIGDRNSDGIFPPVWNRSTGYTYEIKTKLNSTDSPGFAAATFQITEKNGSNFCYLALQTAADGKQYASLVGSSAAGAQEISAGWHTYRVTVSSDGARLYIDGSDTLVQVLTSFYGTASSTIAFGDMTSDQDASFDTSYIAVYAGGAVPAPGSLSRPSCAQGVVNSLDACGELIAMGHGLVSDLNGDCKVDFKDMAFFATHWMKCIEPNNSLCTQSGSLRVIDHEIHYMKEPNGLTVRPAPYPAGSRSLSLSLGGSVTTPWAPGTEFMFSDNTCGMALREPDRPWMLQLGYSSSYQTPDTPGQPGDDYKLWYCTTNNDGITQSPVRQVILCGPEYNAYHPINDVNISQPGSCYVMTGVAPLVRASNGELLVPFSYTPHDANGQPMNPYNTTSFSYAGVLIGRWLTDGSDIVWTQGNVVKIAAEVSTRGFCEPTIAELGRPGDFILILRGSNQNLPQKPGYKWVSYSHDYCRTWSEPVALTYSDGTKFYSPSSCSTVLKSVKNGRIYWVGNICPSNPNANSPRYPLVIGEIDPMRGLIRESVITIDTYNSQYDSAEIQLSNHMVYQDAATGNILVVLYRFDYWWESNATSPLNWHLIEVPEF